MEVRQPFQSMAPGSYDKNGQHIDCYRYDRVIRKSSWKAYG
jgi:hypothetical protein